MSCCVFIILDRELTDGSVEENDINSGSQLTLALRVQTGMKVSIQTQ